MKKTPPYQIIFQDEYLVAVNKMPGLAVIPGRGRSESLLEVLKSDPALLGKIPLPVHRIDADTSGIVIFALTAESQRFLAEQFLTRTAAKTYWALVRGTPLHESGSVDLPVGIDPNDKKRMIIRGIDPKPARTKWVLAKRYRGISLLHVFPVTGRRHQIRVHLKAMGYPLAVDLLYGGADLKLSEFKRNYKISSTQEERPLMSRLTLHAHSLEFLHPATNQLTKLQADLPKDFRTALTALDRWATG